MRKLTHREYEGLMDCFSVVKEAADKGTFLERRAAHEILKKLIQPDTRYFAFIDKLQDMIE